MVSEILMEKIHVFGVLLTQRGARRPRYLAVARAYSVALADIQTVICITTLFLRLLIDFVPLFPTFLEYPCPDIQGKLRNFDPGCRRKKRKKKNHRHKMEKATNQKERLRPAAAEGRKRGGVV